ncbi:MAG: hypothetical protein JWO80_5112, partial [Bryobacterales bacterium]|nr:hypothetical protein [Bryobacterales bacterium]
SREIQKLYTALPPLDAQGDPFYHSPRRAWDTDKLHSFCKGRSIC